MGNDIKKSIHLEFYGLPGSGKSTISHIVANKLRNNGYTVFEPTYDLAHQTKSLKRKMKKIFLTLYFFIRFPKISLKIYHLLQKNNLNNKMCMFHLFNIIPKCLIYKKTKSNTIYIWDEGLIQSSISFSIENKKYVNDNIKNIFEIISYNYNLVRPIFIYIDKKTANIRINNRILHGSRIEKEQDNIKKEKMLDDFYNTCEKIQLSKTLKINSEKEEIEFLADFIYSNLKV